MKRRYTFEGTSQGAIRFNLAYQAMAIRGSSKPDRQVSKHDMQSEARIMDALTEISDPKAEAPEPEYGQPDTRMRVLKRTGGSIELEQADFKRLQDYVDSTQWMPGLTPAAMDLADSLEVDAVKVDKNLHEVEKTG